MLKNFKRLITVFIIISLIVSFFNIGNVFADDLIVPSPDKAENRRVLFFQNFKDKRTSYWNLQGEGAPEIKEVDGDSAYLVQSYDLFDFENVEKLVNFRMEYNMKYSIPEEKRGNAWPAIYLKSFSPTSRYELFFESKEGYEAVTLRRNGVNTLTVPMSFYQYNEQWIYVKVDINGSLLRLYINDPVNPILTFEDSTPPPPAALGFARGRTEYYYIDNLLVTADPVTPGAEDTAFIGIEEVPPKSENVYGKTYIDTDFSDGLDSHLKDLGTKTEVSNGVASVTGRLRAGDKNWTDYSIEMDFALKDKQITESPDEFFKFRCQDEFNYYCFRTNAGGSVIQVYKYENGYPTWVGQNVTYLPERMHKMRMDIHGSTMRFYFRSTSYPNFEYPVFTLSDSSLTYGGIEICKPSYLSRIELDKLIVREIKTLGNTGPRPEPEPFATVTESPYQNWTDVSGHWAEENLKYLANIGAVSGYPDNTFRPESLINVNEALKILYLAKNNEALTSDVYWATPYIDAAKTNGWINSDTFENFERPILRGELLDLVNKLSEENAPDSIIQGDENGNLNLLAPVTRAEAATIISRALSEVFIPQENTEFVTFTEYPLAFANPYKGFRNAVGEPYVTTVRVNFNWNDIEEKEGDGVEKLIAAADEQMKDFPENNVKGVIGVILEFPPSTYWPSDMTTGDYTSEQFKKRVAKMIEKMALAFDNDPRVAFIQMKIIGKWGEMQSPAPTPEVAAIMSECFHKYFKNKLVLTNIVPHIAMFNEHDFGTHWDSFAHWGNVQLLDYFETDSYKEIWKTQMTVGETAFDWGETLGKNPNDAVINFKDRHIEVIRGTHCSSLSWLSRYDKKDPETTAAAIPIQKAMGYRYVLQNARYTKNIKPGENPDIAFNLINTGSAPMYYNEPLELSLLDPETHEVVYSFIFDDVDIRSWLPDEDYSYMPVYTVTDSFTLPENLESGVYTLALSILDSEGGNVPSVRFANTNYFKGGRTPLGNISVGENADIPALDETQFADLFTDRLHYIYTPNN